MTKKGKLIGIGVGPGDTELLTLKAAKVLETVPVVFSPKSSKEKESIALSIVRPVLEKRKDYKRLMLVEPIFPMIEDKAELEKVWTSASEMIAQYLDSGRDVAFITKGCGFHNPWRQFNIQHILIRSKETYWKIRNRNNSWNYFIYSVCCST